jgi:predicted transcriptional regulator
MPKKVTTDVKAAVVLIVTENLTALRMFVKNVKNSVVKFVSKHQKAMSWDKKSRKSERGKKC